MRSERALVRLGDHIELATGHPFKSNGYTTEAGAIRLLRGDNVAQGVLRWEDAKRWPASDTQTVQMYALREDDVVLAMDRPWISAGLKFAHVRRSDLPCLLVQRVARLRSKQGLDSRFLRYIVGSKEFTDYILSVQTGTAVPHISANQIAAFKFVLPPIEEQQEVGELLGALDDRTDFLRQTSSTLEAISQALFKSWFIDFDPVRAKAEGREPEGLDTATAALFPAEFEESELGPVPKGWTVLPIGDLVEAVGGSTPDTKNENFWDPAVHHWTSPKDLSGATAPVLLDTERKVSDAGLAKISSGLLPVGTLLMSSRAPIGYLSLSQVPVAINQGYIAMPPGGRLPPEYMYFWCQLNMDAIKGRANGSTFMEISKKAFRPIPALLPSPAVVNRFHEFAAAVFKRVTANERQARALAELRDTLLPRLISGRLQLRELQIEGEEAVA